MLTSADRLVEPYPTYNAVGVVTTVLVLLLVVVAVRALVVVERRRARYDADAASRDPVSCRCPTDHCHGDFGAADDVCVVACRDVPPVCRPCVHRPHGAVCYARHVLEWGAR